jgi:hypothetical protein
MDWGPRLGCRPGVESRSRKIHRFSGRSWRCAPALHQTGLRRPTKEAQLMAVEPHQVAAESAERAELAHSMLPGSKNQGLVALTTVVRQQLVWLRQVARRDRQAASAARATSHRRQATNPVSARRRLSPARLCPTVGTSALPGRRRGLGRIVAPSVSGRIWPTLDQTRVAAQLTQYCCGCRAYRTCLSQRLPHRPHMPHIRVTAVRVSSMLGNIRAS